MSMSVSPSANNLMLGRGAIYVDVLTAAGVRTGEFALGNCETFEISMSDEKKDKYSSQVSESPLLKSVLLRRTVELRITGGEFSDENLKLLFMGSALDVTQVANTIANVVCTTNAVAGRWFECGYRDLSNVVVSSNAVVQNVTDDYLLDVTRGRVYVVPGGSIIEGQNVRIDSAAIGNVALSAISGAAVANLEAFVRFVGDPSAGPAFEVECWKVDLAPDGAVGLISDDWGTWTLKGKIADDTANHSTAPYFRVIEP